MLLFVSSVVSMCGCFALFFVFVLVMILCYSFIYSTRPLQLIKFLFDAKDQPFRCKKISFVLIVFVLQIKKETTVLHVNEIEMLMGW